MESKNCPSCNAGVLESAKFCPECGVPLSADAKPSSQTSGSNAIRDIGIIVGVLAVVAVLFFVLKRPTPTPMPANQPEKEMTQQQMPPQYQDQAQGQMQGMPQGHDAMSGMPALDSLPKDYAGLVNIGNQNMDHQQFAIAAECYKRALALNGTDQNVRVDYGACLHGMGLADRAIEEFQTALKSQPNHPVAHFNLGVVYMDKQNKDSAKFYLQKYLKLDPNGQAAEAAKNLMKELGG